MANEKGRTLWGIAFEVFKYPLTIFALGAILTVFVVPYFQYKNNLVLEINHLSDFESAYNAEINNFIDIYKLDMHNPENINDIAKSVQKASTDFNKNTIALGYRLKNFYNINLLADFNTINNTNREIAKTCGQVINRIMELRGSSKEIKEGLIGNDVKLREYNTTLENRQAELDAYIADLYTKVK